MLDDKHYSQENILIHEFAHSVMCIGMDDEQRQSIRGAYEEAKQSGLYQKHIYMMANADEYWAEATQSWFDATVRTGDRHACHMCMKVSSSIALSDVIKSTLIASVFILYLVTQHTQGLRCIMPKLHQRCDLHNCTKAPQLLSKLHGVNICKRSLLLADADVNDGFNTREKIKAHDPMLAMLLMHAYGDGPWRYTHTMPRNWGGRPRSAFFLNSC